MDLSRRGFLGGRGRLPAPIRPPWSLTETHFTDHCDRCGACVTACEPKLIRPGVGGFPEVDFSQSGCTQCGACVATCASSALLRGMPDERPAWRHQISIATSCLAHQGVVCRTCGEACDEGAIRFQPRPGGVALPQIDPSRCNGCGACIAPCPSGALSCTPITEKEALP